MKTTKTLLLACGVWAMTTACTAQKSPYNNADFAIEGVQVVHRADMGVSVWSIDVKGQAGATVPTKAGQLDGAPVLGYVFPTDLKPENVGFGPVEGIVALALTSHPDFDDTPLWDENMDRVFDNDGVVWHPHWVVLHSDKRVNGGLSVVQFDPEDKSVTLPPTNPGMPMYMDSPGFPVTATGSSVRVVVPDYRMGGRTDFKYDGVAAYMKVNTSDKGAPMLGVYEVFSVASGDLSLPYTVKQEK